MIKKINTRVKLYILEYSLYRKVKDFGLLNKKFFLINIKRFLFFYFKGTLAKIIIKIFFNLLKLNKIKVLSKKNKL
jgi:hypothetical protein